MSVIEQEVAAVGTAIQMGFDYGQIDEGIRDEVKQAARTIRQLEQGLITGIVAIGKRLIEVKGMLDHGQFEAWIEGEFGMKPRMAQTMMGVARECADPQKRKTYTLLNPSVAYVVAAPSYPAEAYAEIEQVVAAGERVTIELAKEVKAKHVEPKPVYSAPQVLTNMAIEWIAKHARETVRSEMEVLEFVAEKQTTRADSERRRMENWLREQGCSWANGVLGQTITNLLATRRAAARQAQLQASGKAVYVEPAVMAAAKAAQADPAPAGMEYTEAVRAEAASKPEAAQPVAEIDDVAAKLRHICQGAVEADVMLGDLAEMRQGWYHELVLSYIPPTVKPEVLARAAKLVIADRAVAATVSDAVAVAARDANSSGQSNDKAAIDPVVGLLIDPATPESTLAPGGLHHTVRGASVEQLQAALRRLPDELRRGRGPVLEAALKRHGVKPEAAQEEAGRVAVVTAETRVEVETPPDLVAAGYTMLRVGEAWGWIRQGVEKADPYRGFPVGEVITGYQGGKPFSDAKTAIEEARRDMLTDMKMGLAKDYYPVKGEPPVMHADLLAAGYELIGGDGDAPGDGNRGYRWRLGEQLGPNVAYAGAAIEGARAHYAAALAYATPAPEQRVFDPEPVATCRVCGCTDDRACEGGCWWVEPDLCSTCASRIEAAVKREPSAEHQITPPTPPTGILTDAWIAHTLTHANIIGADFATALKAANADQIRAAMCELSTEDEGHAERLAAFLARLEELEPRPVGVPVEDIQELLAFYAGELSHRPQAVARVDRVRRWLDSIAKESAPEESA